MPSQHRFNSISLRPGPHRDWLLAYAEKTGQAVNAVLVQALAEFRERHSSDPVNKNPANPEDH